MLSYLPVCHVCSHSRGDAFTQREYGLAWSLHTTHHRGAVGGEQGKATFPLCCTRTASTVPSVEVPPNSRLRIGDVVRLTGLAFTTVRKLIDNGTLQSERTEGGQRIVIASSVEEYLARRTDGAA